jgi:hypothetical protein
MIPRDPGLQPQRIVLAWSRTGLAVLVNALIVLRSGIQYERPSLVALGGLLLGAAAALAACGVGRVRHMAAQGKRSAVPRMLIVATLWVTWLACVGGSASIVVTLPDVATASLH